MNLCSALTAATLKSSALEKKLGEKKEQFAITVLLDCRDYLEPQLPKDAIGEWKNLKNEKKKTFFFRLTKLGHHTSILVVSFAILKGNRSISWGIKPQLLRFINPQFSRGSQLHGVKSPFWGFFRLGDVKPLLLDV